MNLTREEFCLFNTNSKFNLIKKDGYCMDVRDVGQDHDLFLFRIYNFYVEMLVDRRTQEVVAIDPVRNKDALTLYADRPG